MWEGALFSYTEQKVAWEYYFKILISYHRHRGKTSNTAVVHDIRLKS